MYCERISFAMVVKERSRASMRRVKKARPPVSRELDEVFVARVFHVWASTPATALPENPPFVEMANTTVSVRCAMSMASLSVARL